MPAGDNSDMRHYRTIFAIAGVASLMTVIIGCGKREGTIPPTARVIPAPSRVMKPAPMEKIEPAPVMRQRVLDPKKVKK